MKIIAALFADLARSPLGTASRLAEPLAGKPILRRTVERALRVKSIASVHVLCLQSQAEITRGLLAGLPVHIEPHDAAPPPYAQLVRAGRIWGLDAWRGGIASLCCFDEDLHIPALTALAGKSNADAVASIPAAAPLFDPALADAMLEYYRSFDGNVRLSLVQAPPGLAPFIVATSLLNELLPTGQPAGALLAYRPDHATPDIIYREGCYRPPTCIVEASGRLLADTRRSLDRIRALFDVGGEDWPAAKIAEWLISRRYTSLPSFPEEIEIELTTQDPIRQSLLRPCGEIVPPRGPLPLDDIKAMIESISDHDDVRIVLGGFGEPCLHPQFPLIIRFLRESPIAAIALRTNALALTDDIESALFDPPIDLIEIALDATTRETYRALHGIDAFDRARAALERWLDRRAITKSPLPLILPSFIKARENLHELEPFFDGWQRRLGAVLVTGYSHCAGQLPDRAVLSSAPPHRDPCRRVFRRILVLADGSVTTCDQDFAARQALGNLRDSSLPSIWNAATLGKIRRGRSDELSLCPRCDQWHRP